MGGATGAAPVARWRRVTSVALLAVGAVAAVGSAIAVFARTELLDTDRYVATVEPLADQPVVRRAVARFVVDSLFEQTDVQAVAHQSLSPEADFLAQPLTLTLKAYAQQEVEALLASPDFRARWSAANRDAHDELVELLENKVPAGAGEVRRGVVSIDLAPTIALAKARLSAAGLTFVDDVQVARTDSEYELVSSRLLGDARGAVAVLDAVAWALPAIALVAFGGSIALAGDRRRAVVWVGLGLALPMAALWVALAVARTYYIRAAAGEQVTHPVAAAVFDTLVRSLRDGALLAVVVGVAVAVGAWLTGPSRRAREVRRATADLAAGIVASVPPDRSVGRARAFTATHHRALALGAAAVAFLVILAWPEPTLTVIAVAFGLLVLAALLVLGAARAARAEPGPDEANG